MGTILPDRLLRPAGSIRGRTHRGRWCVALLLIALITGLLTAPRGIAVDAVPLSDCTPSDNGDPVVQDVSISPRVIDVSRSGATVTIETTAVDSGGPGVPSGITRVSGLLTRIPNGNRKTVSFRKTGSDTWVGTAHFARGSRPGRWRLGLEFQDGVGNHQNYIGSQLRSRDLPSSLTVRSVYDTQPPQVTSLSLSSTSVDTRAKPATVRISAHVRDNLGVKAVYLQLGGKPVSPDYVHLALTKGSARSGTWTGSLPIRRWAGTGDLTLDLFALPQAGHYRRWSAQGLARYGFSSRIHVRSASDTEPPTLTVLGFTPRVVDVTSRDAVVEITVRAQDAGSGTDWVEINRVHVIGPKYFHTSVPLRRISGTALDGTWTGSFVVNHCEDTSDRGDLSANDRNDEHSSLDLTAAGLTVTGGDREAPAASADEGNDPNVVAVTFDEGVSGITADDLIVFTVDVSTDVFNYAPVPGQWVCRDQAGIATDCHDGVVRLADFQPATPLGRPFEYWVKVNPEHHLGVRDLAGNPPWRDVAPGVERD